MKIDSGIPTSIIGLIVGVVVILVVSISPSPIEGVSDLGWRAIGITLLMAIWWATEALPVPVTSLLPIILAPLLSITSLKTITASYAHPLIFLFLGGFMLSLAMERCQLHRRIALRALIVVGTKPQYQVAGVMVITAFLSMWMSNTATAVMMLPIALSIVELGKSGAAPADKNFPIVLLLSIAYSASIGGVATLIGTPPNALLAAYLADTYSIHIGFAQWMLVGLPLSCSMLILCWLWLTRWGFKLSNHDGSEARVVLRSQFESLGVMSTAERRVAWIFSTTAIAWMTRPMIAEFSGLNISDTGIALIATLVLFVMPSGGKGARLLDWESTQKLPWGVLLLFGGGLSLASMLNSTGLATYIVDVVSSHSSVASYILILMVVVMIVFLTEVTSNTATTAAFLPLIGPISLSVSGSPLMLTIPAAIAASCAFMMPVATPPNSIVFASGEVKVKQMMQAGFVLNIFSISLVSLVGIYLAYSGYHQSSYI